MLRELVEVKNRVFVGFSTMKTQEKVHFWAIHFPYDLWWRRKYNIPFLSIQHKQMSFEAIKFEYLENKMVQEIINKKEEKQQQPVQNELYDEIASMDFDEIQKLVNGS